MKKVSLVPNLALKALKTVYTWKKIYIPNHKELKLLPKKSPNQTLF